MVALVLFAQPDIPERVINADPDAWYRGDPEVMGQENYDEWRTATRNPDVVRAMLEDYRAGLTVDCRHEEADRARGTRIDCPVLILWSLRDDLEDLYGDPRSIWRGWADDVRGHGIDAGHHVAEEAPARSPPPWVTSSTADAVSVSHQGDVLLHGRGTSECLHGQQRIPSITVGGSR